MVTTIHTLTISQPRNWGHWLELEELARKRRSDRDELPPENPCLGISGGIYELERDRRTADLLAWVGDEERTAEAFALERKLPRHIAWAMFRRLERAGALKRRWKGGTRGGLVVLWSTT
jgi:hypothetical protein